MRQIKSTRGGERVELQGGRILRSTGRKDRHSKICTAKGPRDRRLRLSAHTAIQFYDVQDRLGCNRPSEAIDWLMKEAKSAIDALDSADQNPEKEQQGKTEYIPYSGCGNGNQSQQHLNEEEPINGYSFFVPSFSSGFQIHPNNEGNPTEFHHHLSLISSCESPAMNWSNPPTGEIGQSQKMIAWNSNSIGQDQFFSQGGTLQSSYLPSFLALMNSPLPNANFDQIPEVGLSSVTGNCFAGDGFSGDFVFPGVRGEGEKHHPCPNKPSSAPCVLHYQD